MRIADRVEMLEVGSVFPVLIWSDTDMALVDACYPLQYDELKAAVRAAGFSVRDITKIILTHQDLDHIGCVKEVLEAAPKARVLAHRDEAPYIDGRKTPVKLTDLRKNRAHLDEALLQRMHDLEAGFSGRRIRIDEELSGGDTVMDDIRVIHTPGHTPGHICLFAQSGGVLITGDALNVKDGALSGPNPVHTKDMNLAMASLRPLADLPIASVIAYHGGLFRGDVRSAISKIISGHRPA
ncbi:MAG: MBL fold metallo-hydrolase [Christensenellales bacterium]|jgi:glyoxylase-like metal-dependent hydrolase (beta-lactamase superfamily II)